MSATRLRKERGVWVFQTGKRLSAAVVGKVLRKGRQRRDHGNRVAKPQSHRWKMGMG
ncbi:MAG TPA: hypothetical protein VGV35_18460 [Bryobacteraceae bacterium]|nr:hypothetical protein [Bryobacteraceae bacterium]